MTRQEARELLAAYALNALSDEEALAVEAHVRASDDLRHELRALQDVAAALASGVPQVEPPAGLRGRVLAALDSDAAGPSSAPRAAAGPRVVRFPQVWAVALAAAAALVFVFAGLTYSLNRQMEALNERLATQERVLALLASPATKVASLQGTAQGNVRFVYHQATRQGALIVSDLNDPGAEFVYQLWLIPSGQAPESAGVFRPALGRPIILPVGADFARYQTVAITVERGPNGNPAPTTTPILASSL